MPDVALTKDHREVVLRAKRMLESMKGLSFDMGVPVGEQKFTISAASAEKLVAMALLGVMMLDAKDLTHADALIDKWAADTNFLVGKIVADEPA